MAIEIVVECVIISLNGGSLEFLNELISKTKTLFGINRPILINRSNRTASVCQTVNTSLASRQTQRKSFQRHPVSLQLNENLKITFDHRKLSAQGVPAREPWTWTLTTSPQVSESLVPSNISWCYQRNVTCKPHHCHKGFSGNFFRMLVLSQNHNRWSKIRTCLKTYES